MTTANSDQALMMVKALTYGLAKMPPSMSPALEKSFLKTKFTKIWHAIRGDAPDTDGWPTVDEIFDELNADGRPGFGLVKFLEEFAFDEVEDGWGPDEHDLLESLLEVVHKHFV